MNTTNQKELGTVYTCGHKTGTPSMIDSFVFDDTARKLVKMGEVESWHRSPGQCACCFGKAMAHAKATIEAEGGAYDWIGVDACY